MSRVSLSLSLSVSVSCLSQSQSVSRSEFASGKEQQVVSRREARVDLDQIRQTMDLSLEIAAIQRHGLVVSLGATHGV